LPSALAKLAHPDPIHSPVDHDLGVQAIADIAGEALMDRSLVRSLCRRRYFALDRYCFESASKSNDPAALMRMVGTVSGVVGALGIVMAIFGMLRKTP
jgi:hypothetical protein